VSGGILEKRIKTQCILIVQVAVTPEALVVYTLIQRLAGLQEVEEYPMGSAIESLDFSCTPGILARQI